jgi:hypothetical protein
LWGFAFGGRIVLEILRQHPLRVRYAVIGDIPYNGCSESIKSSAESTIDYLRKVTLRECDNKQQCSLFPKDKAHDGKYKEAMISIGRQILKWSDIGEEVC